jgi:hypothetical protein
MVTEGIEKDIMSKLSWVGVEVCCGAFYTTEIEHQTNCSVEIRNNRFLD